jgi:hypothetical protein
MISRSLYNLKIDTICMCDIPFDRSILQLSNGIRHVIPSTDRMLELTAKHRWLSRLTVGCVFQWVKLCCMLANKINVRLSVLHTSVTKSRLNLTVCLRRQVMLCTVHTAIALAVFLSHAVAVKLAMHVGLVGGNCGTRKVVMFVIIRSCALGIYDLSKFLGGKSQI